MDTDEIAAMERLREEHHVEVAAEEGLAQRLEHLWAQLEGSPRLAQLVRLDAEGRSPSTEAPQLQLLRDEDTPCQRCNGKADENHDRGHEET